MRDLQNDFRNSFNDRKKQYVFKITMNKGELIHILEANKEEHADTYQKAMEIFRVKIMEDLNNKVDTLKAGKLPDMYIKLPVPEEHTNDYAEVISMLTHDINEEIDLDQSMYKQYVMNDWAWNRAFLSNTSSYVSGANG